MSPRDTVYVLALLVGKNVDQQLSMPLGGTWISPQGQHWRIGQALEEGITSAPAEAARLSDVARQALASANAFERRSRDRFAQEDELEKRQARKRELDAYVKLAATAAGDEQTRTHIAQMRTRLLAEALTDVADLPVASAASSAAPRRPQSQHATAVTEAVRAPVPQRQVEKQEQEPQRPPEPVWLPAAQYQQLPLLLVADEHTDPSEQQTAPAHRKRRPMHTGTGAASVRQNRGHRHKATSAAREEPVLHAAPASLPSALAQIPERDWMHLGDVHRSARKRRTTRSASSDETQQRLWPLAQERQESQAHEAGSREHIVQGTLW